MSDWLVPISRHVRFAQTSGRTVDPHYNTLRDAALGGRLAQVDCEVRGPLVNLRSGDIVWCYTTELEVGVFAVGRAKAATKAKRPIVTVTFDKTRTHVLAADPLPAVTIRRWVPELRQGAVSLDVRPRALAVLDAWQRERGQRDAELLGPVGATPWRTAATKGTQGRAARAARHRRRRSPACSDRRTSRSGLESRARSEPRLVARRVRDVVVVDVCRRPRAAAAPRRSTAIGPLLMAQWRLEREAFDGRTPARDACGWRSRRARTTSVTTFLEDSGMLVELCPAQRRRRAHRPLEAALVPEPRRSLSPVASSRRVLRRSLVGGAFAAAVHDELLDRVT